MPPNPALAAVKRARVSVILLFVLNGMTFGNIVPRYPLIIHNLGVSNTWFGIIVASGPAVGLLTGLATSTLIRRFGPQAMAVWANVASIVAMALVLNAPTAWLFAIGLICMCTFDVYTDIAMNAEGLAVQKLYGRSIINSFHAWWSVGAVVGGAVGSSFASIALPLWQHSVVVVVVMCAINVYLRRLFLPSDMRPAEAEPAQPVRHGMYIPAAKLGLILLMGVVAAFGASVEDSAGTWSALYLRDDLAASAGVAGLGFTGLMTAQMIGRFTGDRLVDQLGDRAAARLGCGLAALVWIAAIAWPSVPLTIIAFTVTGWGVATVVPATYYAADTVPGFAAGDGLTVVNWVLRFAFLVGPPLVGRLSDVVSLRWALGVIPAAMIGVVALSGVLASRPHAPLSDGAVLAEANADPTR